MTKEYRIQSKNFLPESIRDYELHVKFTELLDYIIEQYHTKNIDLIKAMYDIRNSDFRAERIMELLKAEEFLDLGVNEEQIKTLCVLLSNLYEIKGTKRGLQYLLRLLDIECKVYEWYDINKWYEQGDPKWRNPVEPCSIVIELGLEHRPIGVCDKYDKWALPRTGSPAEETLGENQAFEDTEGKFLEFARQLLWVCVSLSEIRWAKVFTDYVDVKSHFAWESAEIFYDKYSPYAMNCPGSIQVGYPVFQQFPFVGDPVKVGEYTYKGYPFFVRSYKEYNDPVNYEGWLNTGFVGYSKQKYSDTPALVGTEGLKVGDGSPFWAWGYSETAKDDYLLFQRVVVGGRYIESDISPVNCWHVSGCQPSILETYLETCLEDIYTYNRGILVGNEHYVQAPNTPVDSYIVSDKQGDILDFIETDVLEDTVDLSIPQEVHTVEVSEYASHISDLYESFLVGDPTKFVGDTNLIIGHDYFFTLFAIDKEVSLAEEQFFTNCIQVGKWGHGYTEGKPYTIYVGDTGLYAGVSHFVGEETTPVVCAEKTSFPRVGTCFLVGSDFLVSPDLIVGGGFNYVGSLYCHGFGEYIQNSQNLIYENLESQIITEEIQEEVPVFEQLDSLLTQYELSSNIYENIWVQVVGSPKFKVGYNEYFTVGDGAVIGETDLPVGYSVYHGEYYVSDDNYSKLELHTGEDFTEQFFTNCVQVGKWGHGYTEGKPYTIYVGDTGLYAGISHFVGEETTPVVCAENSSTPLVGSCLLVGSDITVDPVLIIGSGTNYVGALYNHAIGDIVKDSKNIIYENIDYNTTTEITEEVSVSEQFEVLSAQYEFSSSITDITWNKVVGYSTVGYSPYLLVGDEQYIGDTDLIVGLCEYYLVGDDYLVGDSVLIVGASSGDKGNYVAADEYSKLIIESTAEELSSGNIYYNYPIVQEHREYHIFVGDNAVVGSGLTREMQVGDSFIGEEETFVGGTITNPGTLNTVGKEFYESKSLSTLLVGKATVGQTSFVTESPDLDSAILVGSFLTVRIDDGKDNLTEFTDRQYTNTSFTSKIHAPVAEELFQVNLHPDTNFILSEDGSILSHALDSGIYPILIATETGNTFSGFLETNPENSIFASMSHEISISIQEHFNLNVIDVPVLMRTETGDILLLSPEAGETNPVYLFTGETEDYTPYLEINVDSAINDSLFYLIEEID